MSPPTSNREKDAQLSKRERGIIAQREYRKRHSSKFHSLKDDNQRLRNAIRKIHKVVSKQRNLGREFYDALSDAVELAGLEEPEQPRTGDTIQQDAALSMNRSPSPETPMGRQPSGASEVNVILNSQGKQLPSYVHPPLWLDIDRLVRIYDMPTDVVPYLGEGLFTLAGCLYWDCACYAVSLWKKTKNIEQSSLSHQSRLDRIFNHSKHLYDHPFLLSIAQARLEFRKKGFVDRIHVQGITDENEALSCVNERVKQEYVNRNEALHWWRDPQQVENYIRQYLAEDENNETKYAMNIRRGLKLDFEVTRSIIPSI